MLDSEVKKYIRDEIRRNLNIILSGAAGSNTSETEDISEMFPGMPTISGRPVMHPYGVCSRAPAGTIQVIGRQGEHIGNRLVLGHRDANRPSLESGEVILYNQYGQEVYLKNGEIHIGSKAAAQNVTLGPVVQQMLSAVLGALASHTHICSSPGAPSAPPSNASIYSSNKSSPVDDGAMLSDTIFVEK